VHSKKARIIWAPAVHARGQASRLIAPRSEE
jgi:hypothetical protein